MLDMASFAAHKVHGPKGVGALYLRKGLRIKPTILGGGQEKNLFSGTHNVPAIAGWGVSCKMMMEQKEETRQKVQIIHEEMRKGLLELGATINSPDDGSPYLLNVAFPGYLGENILNYLSNRGIYISTGSACSAKKPSRVMTAIGKENLSRYSLRFSFSGENRIEEVPIVLQAVADALNEISTVR